MITLKTDIKTKSGTQYNRLMRKFYNKIPAIIYGFKNNNITISIFLNHNDFLNAQKKKNFYVLPLCLLLENKKYIVKIKEIQRHPIKSKILHIDFLHISK
ncbi:50S ribosomal protein L25 [Buchnera aphidicola]|uniref:50S ribosomal protein L25 n=1 Tax=Buchnera aphidicola subsp. Tuberolachnus salignus TaxID=98804 RepID=A0A160SVT4_BUCTT|nr:50S ribosomal protein L25 [Buchnera aphidicola]CUR53077.1 50S ribosomal protein L25 [Buchnera aphidicola (Tuberolachnus salignus)]